MTIEQFVAIMGAATTLIGVLGAIFVQLRATHQAVNGRMEELIRVTRQAATKEGELAGRDFSRSAGAVDVQQDHAQDAHPE